MYACILIPFLNLNLIPYIEYYALAAILLGIGVFWILNKKFFQYVLPIFWKAFGYSALVQFFQILSAYFILQSLDIELNTISYLFIFLVSSIVSVIPLTIGGIGSRELAFFCGATLLHLDENTSIGISMIFFLITAFVSLFGIYYHFKKPELKIEI
jgi:hypothetical protein